MDKQQLGDTLIRLRNARKEALRQLAARLQTDGVALYAHKDFLVLVHPSTKSSRWQVSYYRDSGITGDTQHDTLDSIYQDICNATPVPAGEIDARLAPAIKAEAERERQMKEMTTCQTAPTP